MRPFILLLIALAALCPAASSVAVTVYDTRFLESGSNETSDPFAPRVLEFITLDQTGPMELDGFGFGFVAFGADAAITPMTTIEFWSGVTPEGPDPLAGAESLGSLTITSGERTNDAFIFVRIASGLSENNDIILPGNTLIGVQFSYADQNGPDSPVIGSTIATPATPNIGAPFYPSYYIDVELDGFDADDLVVKTEGKTMRLEIITIDPPTLVLDGDYNGDDKVDAADYAVWRNNLNQPVTLPGDTTPGSVDQADYDVWRQNYGMSNLADVAAASPAPEPMGLGGLAIACCCVLTARKRRLAA